MSILSIFSASSAKQSSTACARSYILRFVDNSTRVQLAYDNDAQHDARALAVLMRGVAVTLAYARSSV